MPPDAEKLRQRVGGSGTTKVVTGVAGNSDAATVTTTTNHERLCTLSKLTNTEFCIDGIIYDVSDFQHQHPGGLSFLTFTGNDVTVQYKMIHPYHTSKHLLKMKRVGKVIDYTSE
jgi:acyl-lipid (7-3)-desaturase (Delta-4 desaturase)